MDTVQLVGKYCEELSADVSVMFNDLNEDYRHWGRILATISSIQIENLASIGHYLNSKGLYRPDRIFWLEEYGQVAVGLINNAQTHTLFPSSISSRVYKIGPVCVWLSVSLSVSVLMGEPLMHRPKIWWRH